MRTKVGNLFLAARHTLKGVHPETQGLAFGLKGVLTFSLTLPATRLAVAELDATVVGLGRAVMAAILAALLLKATGQPRPSRQHLPSLVIIAAGAIGVSVAGSPVCVVYIYCQQSTHSFRRTALTQMSDAGIPLRLIAEVSGHRDLSQLQAY